MHLHRIFGILESGRTIAVARMFEEENVEGMDNNSSMPILIPVEPADFWQQVRVIIREEFSRFQNGVVTSTTFQTPGLTYKPLYKIKEVCQLFQVTRPTLYEWIKEGRLRPHKIKSRVYFLHNDIMQLLSKS